MGLVTQFVPNARDSGAVRLDGLGLALSGLALASMMFGLETTAHSVVPKWLSMAVLGLGVLAGTLYILHARRHPAPLLDVSLMRIPTFLVSVVGGSLFRIGVGAAPFLLPLMFQLGFGDSAMRSGAITLASSAGAIVMKPATIRALRWFGFRNTLLVNGLLSAGSLILCAAFRPAWPVAAIYVVLLTGGFFRSLQFTAYNTVAYADIPPGRMSGATSLYATLQQVSLTLGVTAGAASLEATMALTGRGVPATADFSIAFMAVGVAALAAAPVSWLMPRHAGAELSGHHADEH
jgi:Na+/melibiose symporter-like transporter